MTTNKELLELAAKAAGMKILGWLDGAPDVGCARNIVRWNPLDDNNDALRLVNALKLSICHTFCESPTAHGTAMVGYAPWEKGAPICAERYDGIDDRDAATRRAIVRAAASVVRGDP